MIGKAETHVDGESVSFVWRDQRAGIDFTSLYERQDGLHGEISVKAIVEGAEKPSHIHWARLNLSSTTARDGLTRLLNKRTMNDDKTCAYNWDEMIEYGCSKAAQLFRDGEPFVDLATLPRPPKLSYLVDKLVIAGKTNVIYSKGASGKSLLALAVALSVSTGLALPSGLVPQMTGPVLYLDYETDEEEQRLRLDYLTRGLNLASVPSVICRRQMRPLAMDIQRIRREVREKGIVLVIVDSIAYAMGGNALDAEVVINAFNALRTLGACSRLVIGHIPKADKESKEASIFGSVFQENAGRSLWELRSNEENDGLSIGLFQRKLNWGKHFAPFGLRFRFDNDDESVRILPHSIEDDAELASHGSIAFQILSELRSGAKGPKAVAEAIGANYDTTRRTMQRLADRGQIVNLNGVVRGSRGHESIYGLAANDDRF